MDVNLPYVNLVFPVDKYDDRLLRCFSSFLTYFKYRKIDNWIVVGNLDDKEEYIINNYSHKYGIRNLHVIKTGCNKSYEELSKIGIASGFNNNEICYVADFKTEFTKEFNPGVLINILNREQNIRSIRLTGKDYKKIGKCNYKILNLTDRFSYDGNYLIKNGSGNDLIVDFKVDGIKSIEIKQIIKEEPKKPVIEQIPYVTVVMTTHNRTNVACAVIDSLVKNIKYPKLKWCISDDRSDEGHVDKLVEQFKKNGINEVHVEKTNKERYGLGASLNNGLKYAWTNSDIVLTTEDDWILEKELKLAHYVDIINKNNDIGGIRLATMNYAIANKRSGHKGFYIVESDGKYKTSVFNNQVMLRHKRTYDKIGYYKENCSGDVSEIDEINKFNNQKGLAVLYPDFIKQNSMDDSSMYFIHVGKSVSGHERYGVPERYQWIYDENRDLPYVTVVMTTHNRTHVACAVIDSLCKNLIYPKLKWCISDDRSDEGHVDKLVRQFKINGIDKVHVEKTNNESYGLGAAFNNGLKYAWTNSDIVLTTEDDWILESPLDIKEYCILIKNHDIAAIRLAAFSYVNYSDSKKYRGFYKLYGDCVFNFQVALRHKRIFDVLGLCNEKCKKVERDLMDRYNKLTNNGKSNSLETLIPSFIKPNTLDDPSLKFIHIGQSTFKHRYDIPNRYKFIYENYKTIKDRLYEIHKRRKISIKNTYIVANQLDSITNDPIDSYTFYNFLRKNNIQAIYLINENHPFYRTICNDDSVFTVKQSGLYGFDILDKCYDYFIHCKVFISEGTSINDQIKKWMNCEESMKTVFMQHGIINNWITKSLANICLQFNYINVSSDYEREKIETYTRKFFNKTPKFIIAGLPRYDKLIQDNSNNNEKIIFIMFSCRPSLSFNEKLFLSSKYFETLCRIISDKRIIMLRNNGYQIKVGLHHQITTRLPNIIKKLNFEVIKQNEISEYIRKSNILITDFSSISFDFLYQDKPVIFITPDLNDPQLSESDRCKVQESYNNTRNLCYYANNIDDIIEFVHQSELDNFKNNKDINIRYDKFFKYRKDLSYHLYNEIEKVAIE